MSCREGLTHATEDEEEHRDSDLVGENQGCAPLSQVSVESVTEPVMAMGVPSCSEHSLSVEPFENCSHFA